MYLERERDTAQNYQTISRQKRSSDNETDRPSDDGIAKPKHVYKAQKQRPLLFKNTHKMKISNIFRPAYIPWNLTKLVEMSW